MGSPVGCWIRWSLIGVALVLPACQQEMANQPSMRTDREDSFFPDGRVNRPLVANTVPRGHLRTDLEMYTGRSAPQHRPWAMPAALLGALAGRNALGGLAGVEAHESNLVDKFPFPVSSDVLEHGRNRYMIYCVVCHGTNGYGKGKIVERSYTAPPSYHIERLRNAPVGHLFDVITNGYGSMPMYKQQIPPPDRWAIVAYVRALQLSQHFPVKALPADMRAKWQSQIKVAEEKGQP